MVYKNASGLAIWLYLSALYFLQTATCFTCFLLLKYRCSIPFTRKVVSSNCLPITSHHITRIRRTVVLHVRNAIILDEKCTHFNALYYANALYVFLVFSLFTRATLC